MMTNDGESHGKEHGTCNGHWICIEAYRDNYQWYGPLNLEPQTHDVVLDPF